MKIAVIGSNSFSGASFVAHCLQATDAEVVGVSRSPEPHAAYLPYRWLDKELTERFRFRRLDLNHDMDAVEQLLDAEEPAYVVNFAAQGMVAQSWQHPEQWLATNTVAHVRLHDRLRSKAYLAKYVQTSTPEVYGNCTGLVGESTVYDPSTPYAVSKAACDMSLMTFHRTYGFPVVFTRAANVYGPGQQLYRIVPRAILASRTGKRLQLHGGGQSTRAFIHIRDVCEATLRVALQGEPPAIFHLSTSEFVSIRDLVHLVCKAAGVRFEDVVEIADERPGKDAAYLLDSAYAGAALGWRPVVGLESGIQETITWFDDHGAYLRDAPSEYVHRP